MKTEAMTVPTAIVKVFVLKNINIDLEGNTVFYATTYPTLLKAQEQMNCECDKLLNEYQNDNLCNDEIEDTDEKFTHNISVEREPLSLQILVDDGDFENTWEIEEQRIKYTPDELSASFTIDCVKDEGNHTDATNASAER